MDTPDAAASRGRYSGIGLYAPGDNWRELADAQVSKDPTRANLRDDDTVIVTIDGQTGEVRQCGNISGICVALNPWRAGTAPAVQTPVRLSNRKAPSAFPTEEEAATSAEIP